MNDTLPSHLPEVSDADLILFWDDIFTLLDEHVGPERGYKAHAERTVKVLQEFDELIPEDQRLNGQLNPAVIMHDGYAHAIRHKDNPNSEPAKHRIASGLRGEQPIDRKLLRYNTSIESCAYGLGKTSERWLTATEDDLNTVMSTERLAEGSHTMTSAMRRSYGESADLNSIAQNVINCINDKSGKIRFLSDEVLKFRTGISLEDILVATEAYDVEAILRSSAELVDNLRNPNRDRPASRWRDAQTALSFFGPALEIIGLEKAGAMVRDEALKSL